MQRVFKIIVALTMVTALSSAFAVKHIDFMVVKLKPNCSLQKLDKVVNKMNAAVDAGAYKLSIWTPVDHQAPAYIYLVGVSPSVAAYGKEYDKYLKSYFVDKHPGKIATHNGLLSCVSVVSRKSYVQVEH